MRQIQAFLKMFLKGALIYTCVLSFQSAWAQDSQLTAQDSQPVAQDSQPVAQDSQPATQDSQPAAQDSQPTTQDSQPVTQDSQSTTQDSQSTTQDSQPVTQDSQSTTQDSQPAAQDSQPTTQDSQPTTQDSQPTTQDSQPVTQDSKPTTQDSKPTTQDSKPVTQDSKPVTQDSQSTTQDSKPTTQDSQPVTQDSKPVTQDSKPGTQDSQSTTQGSQATDSDVNALNDKFLSYTELNQVIITGNVNVILGESQSPNVIEYDPSEVNVNLAEGGLLTVSSLVGVSSDSPTIVVRSKDQFESLNRLVVRGSSSLLAKNILSKALSVELKTAGSIKIEGIMNLNNLVMDNTGEVEIYWVDSTDLDVDIKNGHLLLGGRSDRLTLRATDNADLDATGLIANHAWVAASGGANVEVFPLKTLYAYSKGSAIVNVKYKPEMYVPVNQAPSVIVLNYIDMEKRYTSSVS